MHASHLIEGSREHEYPRERCGPRYRRPHPIGLIGGGSCAVGQNVLWPYRARVRGLGGGLLRRAVAPAEKRGRPLRHSHIAAVELKPGLDS